MTSPSSPAGSTTAPANEVAKASTTGATRSSPPDPSKQTTAEAAAPRCRPAWARRCRTAYRSRFPCKIHEPPGSGNLAAAVIGARVDSQWLPLWQQWGRGGGEGQWVAALGFSPCRLGATRGPHLVVYHCTFYTHLWKLDRLDTLLGTNTPTGHNHGNTTFFFSKDDNTTFCAVDFQSHLRT